MTRNTPETPWWLESGAEICPSCQHSFHYEAGYYCIHCDQPICPLCVVEVHESRETLCPACHANERHEGGH